MSSDDVEFDEDAFAAALEAALKGKVKQDGGRRKFKGGMTPEEIREQLGKLHEDDPELMRIASEMALAADDVSKWAALRQEFTAQKRVILLRRGTKDAADAAIAASNAVLDAAQKLAAAGGKGASAIGDFSKAVASGFRSLVETCGTTATLVLTNAVTARAAFGLGTSWAETHSVQGVADDYLAWVRAMTPFDAALAGAGAVLALQVASNTLLSCMRRRADALAPAGAPAGAPAAAAQAAAPAGAPARRNSRWGPAALTDAAPRGGRRTKRRRHHRHRPSAPTRKRRSSSGRNRGGSR